MKKGCVKEMKRINFQTGTRLAEAKRFRLEENCVNLPRRGSSPAMKTEKVVENAALAVKRNDAFLIERVDKTEALTSSLNAIISTLGVYATKLKRNA